MKFLHVLEKMVSDNQVNGGIEMDEKYLLKSHKGEKIDEVKSRHRGGKSSKRGISNDQICLLTAVQRLGGSVLKATNMAAPTKHDIWSLEKNVKNNSMVWIDGKTAYLDFLNHKQCGIRVMSDHTTYTSVDHLNNVNHFIP